MLSYAAGGRHTGAAPPHTNIPIIITQHSHDVHAFVAERPHAATPQEAYACAAATVIAVRERREAESRLAEDCPAAAKSAA